MKKLNLLLIAMAVSHTIVFAQGCLPNGITFGNQTQIDNFQTNYPGCTEILGDVIIHEEMYPLNITNLQGLNMITSIGGDLIIQWDGLLTNLSGLDNLTWIGGQLNIFHCYGLTSLSGLENIDSIGGRLRINSCPFLTSLSSLESLTTIGNNFEIVSNYDLNDFSGMENLVSIGANLLIGRNGLTSLTGLENLTSINGSLNIQEENSLINLTGLTNLTSVGGDFSIIANPGIANLMGIENLCSIGGHLTIHINNSLSSLIGMESITSIGGWLRISDNISLLSLIGIENIQPNSIEYLTIYDNPLLHLCEVNSICEYLAAPGGDIDISDNAPGCNSQAEVEEACLTFAGENIAQEEITIFPNPASSFISIHIKEGISIEQAIIYNHLGQKTLVAKPVNNTVDVSGLKPGMYILEVVTENRTIREILLVE